MPPLTSNIHASEKFFRNVINKAAKQNIPSGRIPNVHNAMPSEAVRLTKERDQLQQENPVDNQTKELNNQINNFVKEHQKQKWLDHLGNCGHRTKKLWDTVKSLNNLPKQPDNQSISFHKKHVAKLKKTGKLIQHPVHPWSHKQNLKRV